ncbi:LptA/OstA family protein [Rugamonas rivuli]|uniref:Organic solvent tolerance-like N-terminal domain-containing protein n=1 Tax=Rugamonas rivuli TaxID=2743358 RepID=A0A843S977_9BURK|nr:LptA/OstA family protein [Rugamonas rivuli]MQA18780.1 hypothetical protein [Rugamonas rivuli]
MRFLLAALALTLPMLASAERADRFQKTVISYDGDMHYDTVKGVSKFSDHVEASKGSLLISSDYLTAAQSPEGDYLYTVTSLKDNVAKFKQKQDSANDKWVNGEGKSIAYREKDDLLTIDDNAKVRIIENGNVTGEATGAKITYDAKTEQIVVKSASDTTGSGKKVRSMLILMPKPAPLKK